MSKVNFKVQSAFDDSASSLGIVYNNSSGVITNFSSPGADRIPAFNTANNDLTSYPFNGTGSIVFSNFTSSMSMTGSLSVTGNVAYNQTTNSQSGTTYTLALADSGKFVEMTASVANTITVPAASAVAWTVGTRIDILQYGAGQTTIVGGTASLRFYSPSGSAGASIKARYGAATLLYRATNEWYLIGNLT